MTRYVIQFEIKKADPKEGSPGHLSVTTMAVKTATDDIVDIPAEHVIASQHSSLMPGGAVCTIANAVTVGILPVPAVVVSDAHLEDVADATSVFRIEVTREQYKIAVREQKNMKAKVENGDILYSILGEKQPLSVAATGLINLAAENHSMIHDRREASALGVVEREDTFGMPLPPHDFSDVHCSGHVKTQNCVGFALEILNKVGIAVTAPLAPSDVAELLREQGFTEVDHNLAMSTATRPVEAQPEPVEAQPEPAKVEKSNSLWGMMFSFFSSSPSTSRTMSADSGYEANTSFLSDTVWSDSSSTASSSGMPTASSSDMPTASSSGMPTASSSDTSTASSSDTPTASSNDAEIAPSSEAPAAASDDSPAFTAFNLF